MPKCDNFWWRGKIYNISWEKVNRQITATTTPDNPELTAAIVHRAKQSPLGFDINFGFCHYSFPEDAATANRPQE